MSPTSITIDRPALRRLAAAAAFATVALVAAAYAPPSVARATASSTFASPEQASQALYLAVSRGDAAAITTILGSAKALVSSSDPAQDRLDRKRFVEKYRQMHRFVREPDATTVLYVGAENWPFPIPLVDAQGAWRFDAERGMDEVLFRRIGENELSAAQACRALVLAQKEHHWAERDRSMGALRGLSGRGAERGVAFHGYVFRALASAAKDGAPSSGLAYVAYPARYGSTGVMTYLVDQDDVVIAKDLGPHTHRIAARMTAYRADATWHPED
jgi:hypothetical protein